MKLKVTLIKSKYGRVPRQRATLEALGFRKTNSVVIVEDNSAMKGMIQTVHHLVKVEEVK